MAKVAVPPVKCQGIKTKLVPWIKRQIRWSEDGRWIEPFLGSGVVGFNVGPQRATFCDNNPHIIRFYQDVNSGKTTPAVVRSFLEQEGALLSKRGGDYYYEVRDRFNRTRDPLDFLFLSRSCFNGLMRFSSKGKFNVPFNHKPERFTKTYITKVVNQVRSVRHLCEINECEFVCQDFRETFSSVEEGDFVYCDPPYTGRHTDYFNTWGEDEEAELFRLLSSCEARFILSTWHSNEHRSNLYIDQFWSGFHIVTRDHYYHVGAKEKNRKPMLEALVMNYVPPVEKMEGVEHYSQPRLLEARTDYSTSS